MEDLNAVASQYRRNFSTERILSRFNFAYSLIELGLGKEFALELHSKELNCHIKDFFIINLKRGALNEILVNLTGVFELNSLKGLLTDVSFSSSFEVNIPEMAPAVRIAKSFELIRRVEAPPNFYPMDVK